DQPSEILRSLPDQFVIVLSDTRVGHIAAHLVDQEFERTSIFGHRPLTPCTRIDKVPGLFRVRAHAHWPTAERRASAPAERRSREPGDPTTVRRSSCASRRRRGTLICRKSSTDVAAYMSRP